MTTKNTHSKSEVGHIKNIENFYDLIQFCHRYGAEYNPTHPTIQIPQLEDSLQQFQEKQDTVNSQFANITLAINTRQYEFEKLKPLTSRVMQALTVATDDKKIIADARTFANKIQGRPPKVKTNDQQDGQEIKEPKSNSQRSFDKQKEHFENLLLVLKTVGEYAPNETDLTIDELDNYLKTLDKHDKKYAQTDAPFQKALTERDNLLYHETKGVVPLAKKVKTYVQSIYGSKSLEFKEINKIQFRTIKRK